jgi:TM2 domain-containing membrane protein YozV
MDPNLLMASLFFGLVGMAMFMYGKKAGRMVALGAGVGLMGIPYFITNMTFLVIVCCALMALPWVIREA